MSKNLPIIYHIHTSPVDKIQNKKPKNSLTCIADNGILTLKVSLFIMKVTTMVKDYKKGIGRVSTPLLAQLSQAGKRIFTIKEAAQILGRKTSNLHKLLHDLVERRWLTRLEKGKYMILPLEAGLEAVYTEHEFIVASSLIQPYYIGFWSALNYYGLTEQVPRIIYVASIKQKQTLTLQGVTYHFIRLLKKKFFGFRGEWIDNKKIEISDREKTILDCLDHPEYCGGITEVAKGLWNGRNELDFEKIIKYGLRMKNGAIFKRLGYILEVYQIGDRATKRIQNHISSGYSILDPTLPKEGRYIKRWNLLINILSEDLKASGQEISD